MSRAKEQRSTKSHDVNCARQRDIREERIAGGGMQGTEEDRNATCNHEFEMRREVMQ